MRFRWTMKELNELPDKDIIKGIINERLSDLNHYAPLAQRLKAILHNMEAKS